MTKIRRAPLARLAVKRLAIPTLLPLALILFAAPSVAKQPAPVVDPLSGFTELPLGSIVAGDLYEMAVGLGGGVAAADYDNDGDIDLFLPNQEGLPDRLLRNNGNGAFTDVAATAGVSGVSPGGLNNDKPRSRGALWVDLTCDRRLDLFVVGDCWHCQTTGSGNPPTLLDPSQASWSKPRLFHQRADGFFVDATASSGLGTLDFLQDCPTCLNGDDTVARHLGGLAAGDLNSDGIPDLFVGHWSGFEPVTAAPHNGRILLSNATTGIFTDADALIGLPGVPAASDPLGSHWQTLIHDFNDDGQPDIFNALDGSANTLWTHSGNVTIPFTEQAVAFGVDHTFAAGTPGQGGFDMGIGVGDIDNDGLFDLYVTNTNTSSRGEDIFLRATPGALGAPPTYSDILSTSGVAPHVTQRGSWGWGVTFLDADLDRWVDLAITNGFSDVPGMGGTWPQQAIDPSLILRNKGNAAAPSFADRSTAWRFNDTSWGSALGAMDIDRNGTPDLVQTTQRAYDSVPMQPSKLRVLSNGVAKAAAQWLTVRPRLPTCNSHSLGAVVRVHATTVNGVDFTLSRLITAGVSFMTQEPAEAHFGLGTEALASVQVQIEWPDGRPDSFFPAGALNRVITYGWCTILDLASPYGQLDEADRGVYMAVFTSGDLRADFAAPWGVLDNADLVAAQDVFDAGCTTPAIVTNDLP